MTRMVVLACVLGLSGANGVQNARDEAVRMAIDALSSLLEIAPDAIRLVSVEAIDWPDSSLGCPARGMVYMPVIVPGFRVRLAVGDREHEVHTGGGRAVVCGAASSSAAPARPPITPALAASDRAKRHLAETLEVAPDDLRVARVRRWRRDDRPCHPPTDTAMPAETFYVELTRRATTYRYRATPDLAWPCK